MKLSVIIPAYNEESTIRQIIERVIRVKTGQVKEVIVIDDGSFDKTKLALKTYEKNKSVKILYNGKNMGKGASIIKGIKESSGDLILIQDADLEYDPEEIPKLLSPFKNNNVQVVYGSRILGENPISNWAFNAGGKLLTLITNILYGTKITDEATGYKVFRAKLLKNLNLKSKKFEFCPEVTAKIAKRKIKIVEVPISYHPRSISEKKIKWYDGFSAIFYLLKYRFFD